MLYITGRDGNRRVYAVADSDDGTVEWVSAESIKQLLIKGVTILGAHFSGDGKRLICRPVPESEVSLVRSKTRANALGKSSNFIKKIRNDWHLDLNVWFAQKGVSRAGVVALPEGVNVVTTNYYYHDETKRLLPDSSYVFNRIYIPDSVRVLGNNAFASSAGYYRSELNPWTVNGGNLYTLEGMRGLRKIGGDAFASSGLSGELILPQGLELIAEYAFHSTKLERVVLPKTLRAIGGSVFNGNTGQTLREIVFERGMLLSQCPQEFFPHLRKYNTTLVVPKEFYERYRAAFHIYTKIRLY